MTNSVRKNLVWIAIDKFGLIFLSLISFSIYAIYLEPSELGKAALFSSIPALVALIFMSSFETPLLKYKTINNGQLSTVFWGIGVFAFCLYLINSVISFYILEDRSDFYLYVFSSSIIIFSLLSRPFVAKLRTQRNFKSLAKRAVFGKVAGMGVGSYFAIAGFGELAVISQNVIQELFSFIFLFLPNMAFIHKKFDINFMKDIIVKGAPMCVRAVSYSLILRCLPIAIGIFAGTAVLGYFNFANRIVSIVRDSIFAGADSYVVPVLSSRTGNKTEFNEMLLKVYHHVTLLVLPLFTGLMCLADVMVVTLFGDKWINSIYLIQLLALASIIRLLYLFSTASLIAYGEQKKLSTWDLCSSAIVLLLSILSLKYLSIEYVLYILIGHYFILGILLKKAIKELTGIPYHMFFNNVKVIVASAFVMSICVIMIKPLLTAQLAFISLPFVGAVVYLLFIFIVDKQSLIKLIKTLSKKT